MLSICSGRILKMVTEMGSTSVGGLSPSLSATAAKSFLEATDKEKKEMQVGEGEFEYNGMADRFFKC